MIRSYSLQCCLDFETAKPVVRMRSSFGWLRKQQPARISGLPVLKTPSRGGFASNTLELEPLWMARMAKSIQLSHACAASLMAHKRQSEDASVGTLVIETCTVKILRWHMEPGFSYQVASSRLPMQHWTNLVGLDHGRFQSPRLRISTKATVGVVQLVNSSPSSPSLSCMTCSTAAIAKSMIRLSTLAGCL